MTHSIKEILMDRDGMTEKEANELIEEAKDDLYERLENGEDAFDICADWFGLEPDYIFSLLEYKLY